MYVWGGCCTDEQDSRGLFSEQNFIRAERWLLGGEGEHRPTKTNSVTRHSGTRFGKGEAWNDGLESDWTASSQEVINE